MRKLFYGTVVMKKTTRTGTRDVMYNTLLVADSQAQAERSVYEDDDVSARLKEGFSVELYLQELRYELIASYLLQCGQYPITRTDLSKIMASVKSIADAVYPVSQSDEAASVELATIVLFEGVRISEIVDAVMGSHK